MKFFYEIDWKFWAFGPALDLNRKFVSVVFGPVAVGVEW